MPSELSYPSPVMSHSESPEPDFQLSTTLRFDPSLLKCDVNTAIGPGPSPFYMLAYHRDRMLEVAKHFGWAKAEACLSGSCGLETFLQNLKEFVDISSNSPQRVQVVIDCDGETSVESSPTSPRLLGSLYPTRIPPQGTCAPGISPLTGGSLSLGVGDTLMQQGPGYGDPELGQSWSVIVDPMKTEPSLFTSHKTTRRDMYNEARARVGIEVKTDLKDVLIRSIKDDEVMEGSRATILLWRGGRWVTPPTSSGGQIGTTRRWLLANGLCVEEVVKSISLVEGEECWLSNGVRGLVPGTIKL